MKSLNVQIAMEQENLKKIKSNSQVLVLNASYEPLHVTSWKRAIILLVKEKATIISSKVIRLVDYIRLPFTRMKIMKPSRAMIYKRDGNKCQYCGSTRGLTIDHVVPKSRGGGDTWENMVVACSSCNTKKSDKLLEWTNMKLVRKPYAPLSKVFFLLHDSDELEWKEFQFV